ncbi:hypothetical protein V490_00864 [Pseudogymnoascus sp. VKM F-3557]|nr:hypothetical protein V490_00864 [Pseudogymnoascus sp. VKM F-3557]
MGQASPLDTDTRGRTWIEKVLYLPLLGGRNYEERMSFLEMLFKWGAKLNGNKSLSSLCAEWSGYGPHLTLLERLITLGHDFTEDTFNYKFDWPPITPVWYANEGSIERDPFLLKFLCQCSKRVCGFWEQTPLMDAILSGSREEIISCLRDTRAVLRRNSLGQTAVHLAVVRPIELSRLLGAGGELNAPDSRGIMPLEYAAVYGYADSVIILLEAGAQITSKDENGSLHIIFLEYATQLAHWDVVKKAILFLRASPYYDNRYIDDELNHLMSKHLQVSDREEPSLNGITLLLELGADLNIIMEDGNTLLHISRGANEAKFLLQAGIEQIDTGIAQQALLDIIRVKKFNKLGMTHTCCSQGFPPPFDISTDKDNAEVSDREKDLIQKLEDFMGFVSKSPLNTVENWIKLLNQFFNSDWEESGYSWCFGVWQGGSMSFAIGGTTPPFYSPSEVKELGSSGEPSLGEKINYRRYIHEPSDTFRVQYKSPPEKTWRSHQGYTIWIDYFKKNWGKYNYFGTIEDDWHKRRKSYIAQQAELMTTFTHTRGNRNPC